MAELIKAPKGTKDIVPSEVYKWHYVEGVLRTIAMEYGFEEIRFPNFEHTELFNRGIGDTTDVVQKEMYTFTDKGGRSVTLRPEGTSSQSVHIWRILCMQRDFRSRHTISCRITATKMYRRAVCASIISSAWNVLAHRHRQPMRKSSLWQIPRSSVWASPR